MTDKYDTKFNLALSAAEACCLRVAVKTYLRQFEDRRDVPPDSTIGILRSIRDVLQDELHGRANVRVEPVRR